MKTTEFRVMLRFTGALVCQFVLYTEVRGKVVVI